MNQLRVLRIKSFCFYAFSIFKLCETKLCKSAFYVTLDYVITYKTVKVIHKFVNDTHEHVRFKVYNTVYLKLILIVRKVFSARVNLWYIDTRAWCLWFLNRLLLNFLHNDVLLLLYLRHIKTIIIHHSTSILCITNSLKISRDIRVLGKCPRDINQKKSYSKC